MKKDLQMISKLLLLIFLSIWITFSALSEEGVYTEEKSLLHNFLTDQKFYGPDEDISFPIEKLPHSDRIEKLYEGCFSLLLYAESSGN
jgi:hypothetical protein